MGSLNLSKADIATVGGDVLHGLTYRLLMLDATSEELTSGYTRYSDQPLSCIGCVRQIGPISVHSSWSSSSQAVNPRSRFHRLQSPVTSETGDCGILHPRLRVPGETNSSTLAVSRLAILIIVKICRRINYLKTSRNCQPRPILHPHIIVPVLSRSVSEGANRRNVTFSSSPFRPSLSAA